MSDQAEYLLEALPSMETYARRKGGNDWQDIVQQASLNWLKRGRFNPSVQGSNVKGYGIRTVQSAIRDHRRLQRRRPVTVELSDISVQGDRERFEWTDTLQKILERVEGRFGKTYVDILLLRAAGHTYGEIQGFVGITQGCAYERHKTASRYVCEIIQNPFI